MHWCLQNKNFKEPIGFLFYLFIYFFVDIHFWPSAEFWKFTFFVIRLKDGRWMLSVLTWSLALEVTDVSGDSKKKKKKCFLEHLGQQLTVECTE